MIRSSGVYIVILNWNGWEDTIECLESVFRSDYPEYRVIVCDNASQDESLERIKAWAEGRLDVAVREDNPLCHFSFPPVPKPISHVEYDRTQAESGGDPDDVESRLVLIQTGANLGFAGGNNVGLRYALVRGDFEYVWLLNNDTVAKPDALSRMVERMLERLDAGICGSTLLYYHDPEVVQALGGATYNKWFGASRLLGLFQPASRPVDSERLERRMSYVTGASMLVSKAFLHDVGLMCEDYFLYFEELDWATRARDRYALAYAPGSIVYHKEGMAAVADSRVPGGRSAVADYFFVRNRLVLTRKFFPLALPTVYLSLVLSLLNRLRRRQWDSVKVIARLWIPACDTPRSPD